MPVEIRELIIRAVTTSQTESTESAPMEQSAPDEREVIVKECVRQVMRILKMTKGR